MKRGLLQQHISFSIKRLVLALGLGIFMFASSIAQGSDPYLSISRDVEPDGLVCNQFNVTLTVTGTTPPKSVETILVIDRSGSMDNNDGDPNTPLPIEAAQDAAENFINELFSSANNPTGLNRIGLVSYASTATQDVMMVTDTPANRELLQNAINNLVTTGFTNIHDAMVKADEMFLQAPPLGGTFNCATERSIILLTDGIANRAYENVDGSGELISCSDTTTGTNCQTHAVEKAVNAQTHIIEGETFTTDVFGVGLFSSIQNDPTRLTIATNTMNGIQNTGGAIITFNNADLTQIFQDILGQLNAAATSLPGEPLVTTNITSNFEYVTGSINASAGDASISGDELSWFVDAVSAETITLQYSIAVSTLPDACGTQSSGDAMIKYESANCEIREDEFEDNEICIPCPDVTASMERENCSNQILYEAIAAQNECGSSSDVFEWEFFLNGDSIGTANDASGVFTYAGTNPFVGELTADLMYTGNYDSACSITIEVQADAISLTEVIDLSFDKVDALGSENCANGTVTANASGGSGNYTYAWSPGGEITQTINNLTEGTYTVTVTDTDSGCTVSEDIIINCFQDEWWYECGDDKTVDEFGYNANCMENNTVNNLDGNTMFQYVVEILYKGDNPGSAISFVDDTGASHAMERELIVDGNDAWMYRASFAGATDFINYIDTEKECQLQSIVVYAFRDLADAAASSGQFIALQGVNSLKTVTLSIPQDDAPRDVSVEIPVSELMPDGSYLLLKAEVGTIADEVFLFGPDTSLPGGTCCQAIPSLTLTDVPGTATEITITIDSRNNENGQVNGQSWIISGINADLECVDCDLVLEASQENIDCFGSATGSIDLTISGAAPPFTFLWSNDETTEDLSELTQGVYSVTVTDAIGCAVSQSFTITQPESALELSATQINIGCFENTTGSIDLTVSGGTAPYTFLWSNGATSEDISELAAGTYSVTVTDANGCIATEEFTITQTTSAILIESSQENISCFGDATGAIDLTVSGGEAPYTFLWSNGATTEDIGDLIAGAYSVSVTYASGCVVEEQFIITQPAAAIELEITSQADVFCERGSGSVIVEAIGGVSPYMFSIDGGTPQNNGTFSGLAAGNHEVKLVDANDCTETILVVINNNCLALIKTGTFNDENGDGCSDVGETISYVFTVINTGNAALTNVTVSDALVTVIGGPLASLAGGTSDATTFSAIYEITQLDIETGEFVNQAEVFGTTPNGTVLSDLSDDNSPLEDEPTVTILCQNTAISLEKSGVLNDENGDLSTQAGETISYSFSVTNTGDVALYDIIITDELPGIELIGGPITELSPGETDSATFTATYVLTQADIDVMMVVNQALVTAIDANGNVVDDTSDDPFNTNDIDPNEDGEPDDPTETILPVILGASLDIFNGISPNEDGLNDYFHIGGINAFPDNNVKIFNRWGKQVYGTDGYENSDSPASNNFRGRSGGRSNLGSGELLPTGTYFYVITFPKDNGDNNNPSNPGKTNYTGYLYINR